jgi:hypothetical protein
MTKAISIIVYTTLILIVTAYPLMLFMTGSSSSQYLIHAYGQAQEDTTNGNNNPIIDGIECLGAEQLAFHIHTKFNITINNGSYPIPAGIGIIPAKCIYWLHTHDNSGIIHIESPIKKGFTLGQFLQIWNNFNSTDTLVQDITNNSINGTWTVYINGTQMNNNNNLDYRNIELKDGEQISLVISRRE